MRTDEIVKLPKHEALSVIVVYSDEPGKEYAVYLFRNEIEGFQNTSEGKIVKVLDIATGRELWKCQDN